MVPLLHLSLELTIPIIWATADILKIYSNYFQKNKIGIKNVYEPIAYSTSFNEEENLSIHSFDTVSEIFPIS